MFPHKNNRPSPKQNPRLGGFTLVEVMIGVVIFTIAMMGMLGTTLMAYRYTLISRYKERAENALMTIADQFQNSPITDKSTSNPKRLFATTSGPTGSGMSWDATKQAFVYPGGAFVAGNDDTTGLTVPLHTINDPEDLVTAHITREVGPFADPYATSAAPTTSYMLQGTFTAKYTFSGDQVLVIKVLRTVTPTDLL